MGRPGSAASLSAYGGGRSGVDLLSERPTGLEHAIKASIPADYFGGSNQQLASAYTAEVEKGTGYLEAMTYCRDVGAVK